MININIKILATLFSMYQKGDLVCAVRASPRIALGECGVVVHSKHRQGRTSLYIVVFERGGIMYIDSQKTPQHIASLQARVEGLETYQYTTQFSLLSDYLAGCFRHAFTKKMRLLKFNFQSDTNYLDIESSPLMGVAGCNAGHKND